MSTISSSQLTAAGSVSSAPSSDVTTIGSSRPSGIRHSLDLKFFQESASSASETSASVVSPPSSYLVPTPPKLQQSFSTSDVPTVKNPINTNGLGANANNHAQQHFHNHNASIGRIPAGAMPNRHSRELSSEAAAGLAGRDAAGYPTISSTLQAQATPFGPTSSQPQTSAATTASISSPASSNGPYPYYNGANYGGTNGGAGAYGTMPLMMSMQGLSLNGGPSAVYSPQNYPGYHAMYSNGPRAQDSQARVIQSRRQLDSEGELPLFQLFEPVLTGRPQPWLATPTCPWKRLAVPSTSFARTSTAAGTCRSSWRTATPSRST